MSKEKKKISLVKKGLLISKTLLFRTLIGKASGVINNPKGVFTLTKSAYNKLKQYDNSYQLTTDVVSGVVLFGEMLKYWARGEYKGFETNKILLIIGALLYLITPLDVIPDVIPFVGLMDDLSLLVWVYHTLRKEVDQFVAWRNATAVEPVKEEDYTYEELYAMAQAVNLKGRSNMSKKELSDHLSKTKTNNL